MNNSQYVPDCVLTNVFHLLLSSAFNQSQLERSGVKMSARSYTKFQTPLRSLKPEDSAFSLIVSKA